MNWNTGTNGTPTPATGTPMQLRPDLHRRRHRPRHVEQQRHQPAHQPDHRHHHADLPLRQRPLAHRVRRQPLRFADQAPLRRRRFLPPGDRRQPRPVRITYRDISGARPGVVEVFDNNNQLVDYSDIANYRGTTANNSTLDYRSGTQQRLPERPPQPHVSCRSRPRCRLAASRREQMLDTKQQHRGLDVHGPRRRLAQRFDGALHACRSTRTSIPATAFRPSRGCRPPAPGGPSRRIRCSIRRRRRSASTELKPRSTPRSASTRPCRPPTCRPTRIFSSNRLRVLGGVRFEHTEDVGQGGINDADAVWQRNPAGNFIRNAAGARIRRARGRRRGFLRARLSSRRKCRASFSKKVYSGYYPSVHLTFNATENFLVRAAYAKTYGRPNFSDIIPRAVATALDLDDDDPTPPAPAAARSPSAIPRSSRGRPTTSISRPNTTRTTAASSAPASSARISRISSATPPASRRRRS